MQLALLTPHAQRIREFMIQAQQDVPGIPQVPMDDVRILRARLIFEECLETIRALGVLVEMHYGGICRDDLPCNMQSARFSNHPGRRPSLPDIADGCADISVVTIGTLLACGIADQPLLEEVDASNLAKFTGDGHRDEYGKWIKPSDWQPPAIEKILQDQVTAESVDGT